MTGFLQLGHVSCLTAGSSMRRFCHSVELPRSAGCPSRVARFFALAFGITWSLQFGIVVLSLDRNGPLALAMLLVAGFGPTLAAYLSGRPSRGPGFRPTLGILALFLPSLIKLAVGGQPAPPDLLAAILPPLGEEPGWRGFAQERMAARLGRPLAFLLLGVAWAVWHLPTTFVYGGTLATFPLFVCQTTLASIWVSWVYERSGLFGAMLAHAGLNLGLIAGGEQVFVFCAF